MPGQFVGEISFLGFRPTSATVTAYSDAKVLRIGRTELEARLSKHPRFAARFYQAFGMRLAQIYRRELTGPPSANEPSLPILVCSWRVHNWAMRAFWAT